MDSFFTAESFVTLGGSALMVVAVVSSIRSALNWGPKWFGLVVSLAVSLLGLVITSSASGVPATAALNLASIVLAILNGCLIYCTAYGIQNTIVARDSARGVPYLGAQKEEEIAPAKITFRTAW